MRPRPVRRCSGPFRATSPEQARAHVLCAARELVHESRLADAAVAADQEQPTAARDGIVQRGRQLFQLAVAPDEDPGRAAPRTRRICGRRGQVERRVLAQDRLFELLQLLARFDPELVDERAPGVAIRLERFGLASAAVEGEHPLPAEALAERMPRDERLELAHELRVCPEQQVGLDPVLDRDEVELFEATDRGAGKRLRGEVRERSAAPERQRLGEALRAPATSPAASRSRPVAACRSNCRTSKLSASTWRR